MYLKFLIFKLPNASNKYVSSIHKRLLRSSINKRNKELQHVLKEFIISENFLSKQLSTIDLYIPEKSVTSNKKKSLQKSFCVQQRKLSSLKRVATYLYSQLTQLLLTSRKMYYHRENPIYLMQVYTFQSNQIKLKNPKSSLSLKRFIVLLLTTLNPKKQKVR